MEKQSKEVIIYSIFFKFSKKNIFINAFKEFFSSEKRSRISLLFRSLNLQTDLVERSKVDPETIQSFSRLVATWLKRLKAKQFPLVVIFKGTGVRPKKRGQTHRGLGKFRQIIIREFAAVGVSIRALVDANPIPYNGCKIRVIRRKKRKHIVKSTFI